MPKKNGVLRRITGVAAAVTLLLLGATTTRAGVGPPVRLPCHPQPATLHVVAVGVNGYALHPQQFAEADAIAVADFLEKQGTCGYRRVLKHVLLGASFSRAGLAKELRAVEKEAQPEDVFMFFFAGFGTMAESGGSRRPRPGST